MGHSIDQTPMYQGCPGLKHVPTNSFSAGGARENLDGEVNCGRPAEPGDKRGAHLRETPGASFPVLAWSPWRWVID